jgi:hypothetical protein
MQAESDPFQTQAAWIPSTLSFGNDINLQISSLQGYLKALTHRTKSKTSCGPAPIKHKARVSLHPDVIPTRHAVVGKVGDARRLILADVESWTSDCLSVWEAANICRASSCSDVARLIQCYGSEAMIAYEDDPEALSLMYLTVLDLWVCLDRIATRHEPILLDYEPGFPPALFDALLLPRKCQLDRLSAAEKYIADRKKVSEYPTIFTSFNAWTSIAVRYFNRSSALQKLHADIGQEALAAREQKKKELLRKKQEKADLEAKSAAAEHTTRSYWQYNKRTGRSEEKTKHVGKCQKCAWATKARNLSIDIHEWPLPTEVSQAKAIVFELKCPETISIWRDSTYCVLMDILTPESARQSARQSATAPRGEYFLRSYDGLRKHYTSKSDRLGIASTVKPWDKSHYRSKTVSTATESNICVGHAPRYEIYDSRTCIKVSQLIDHCEIRKTCYQQLPQGPHRQLQNFAQSTEHVPNQVIADQSNCPTEISIPEFLAFGNLRDGHHLQWQSLGKALRDASLNFNLEATRILVTQAAWQVGPRTNGSDHVLRDTHALLEDSSLCVGILDSLSSAIGTTKENWQGTTSVQIFVALTLRILSLSSNTQVRQQCFGVLEYARRTTCSWMQKLSEKLRVCENDNERESWTHSALEVTLSCFSTFDVDYSDVRAMLTTGNNIDVFVECAITIHDLCPTDRSCLSKHIQKLLLRSSRMTHAIEPTLYDILVQDSTQLDQSLAHLWTSYRPGTPWRAAEKGQKEWIRSDTFSDHTTRSAVVQFNLLSGSLLVNGSPLSRLPPLYEAHDSYRRLFGKVCLSHSRMSLR